MVTLICCRSKNTNTTNLDNILKKGKVKQTCYKKELKDSGTVLTAEQRG
jgi:hypothetical protein